MSHRLSFSVLTGAVLVLGIGWTLHAAARQTPPDKPATRNQQPKTSNQKPPKFADLEIRENPTYDAKTSIMSGRNFTYKEDDMTITGVMARYNDKEKRLLAEGNLTMDDPKYHTTGDKADVDNSKGKKLAIITGNVKIVIKPKEKEATANTNPDAKEDIGSVRRNGGTITCDRVESYYKKDISILSGNLTFKQTIKKDGRDVERTLTADHAEYDGKAEKMKLYPPVKGSDTDGQKMEFTDIVLVGTKEGAETVDSKGPGKFTIHVEEDENDDGKTPPPPPAKDKQK